MGEVDTGLFLVGMLFGSLVTWRLGEIDKRTLRRQLDKALGRPAADQTDVLANPPACVHCGALAVCTNDWPAGRVFWCGDHCSHSPISSGCSPLEELT